METKSDTCICLIAFKLQINDLVITNFSFNLLVLHFKYFGLYYISCETRCYMSALPPSPFDKTSGLPIMRP